MNPPIRPLILLEFNEVNFDYLTRYMARGCLPTLAKLLRTVGVAETASESEYEKLEPWIQWVTAHSGLSFEQHQVFRLGDIVRQDIEQVWEKLEAAGISVAAVSPINAANRTRRSPFFVPDPWTQTPVSGGWILRQLGLALKQAVGENAQQRMTPATAMRLVLGLAAHFRVSTIGELITHALRRSEESWRSVLFLDRLLADVFVRQWRRHQPGFAALFLNGAAHIQHHYMFSSSVYDGPRRNPDWYVKPGADPLLDIYRLYDRILADVQRLRGSPRIMIATGLHQDPHPVEQYYYRLKDHARFLRKLDLPFNSVEARMSRDFTVYCTSSEDAARCAAGLAALRAADGSALFEIDNRGRDLFVMLTYPKEIATGFVYSDGRRALGDLADDVVFVALKNGEHNGIGYFVDTGAPPVEPGTRFPLTQLFARICEAMGVTGSGSESKKSGRLEAA
jgi:hypothetical protein